MEVFKLNKEQQAAFNRFEKAYKDLKKLGVDFYNQYGTLNAYNKKYIKKVDDERSGIPHNLENYFPNNIRIASEWADDQHYIHLTEDGKKLYDKEKEGKY